VNDLSRNRSMTTGRKCANVDRGFPVKGCGETWPRGKYLAPVCAHPAHSTQIQQRGDGIEVALIPVVRPEDHYEPSIHPC
jgi:hypothetical protein